MRVFKFMASAGLLLAALWTAAAPARAEGGTRTPESDAFVRGFVRFLAYHEAGHMLMGQIADLNSRPDWSSADREDYADRFAMILLQPDADDPEGVDDIISAAGGWLQVDSSLVESEPHAPAEVRALEILCLLYGSNPDQFSEFGRILPPGRDCAADYQALEAEIEEVFRDYSGQTGYGVDVVYAAPTGGMDEARQFLIDSGIVEDLKFDIEFDFYLTHKTTIQTMSCGGRAKSDTFYSDRVRGPTPDQDHFVITLCYEMIDMRLKHGLRGLE
jgi:hypothetical protein